MDDRDTQYAVAWMNHFDNELKIEFIFAANWREAVFAHSGNQFENVEDIPDDLEEAKRLAFDFDSMFDVVEV